MDNNSLRIDGQLTTRRYGYSLFDWHNRELPEDLHFMRSDGSLVLGSIAHESYAWAELSAPERVAWGAETATT